MVGVVRVVRAGQEDSVITCIFTVPVSSMLVSVGRAWTLLGAAAWRTCHRRFSWSGRGIASGIAKSSDVPTQLFLQVEQVRASPHDLHV